MKLCVQLSNKMIMLWLCLILMSIFKLCDQQFLVKYRLVQVQHLPDLSQCADFLFPKQSIHFKSKESF